jgi:hypothetical protein
MHARSAAQRPLVMSADHNQHAGGRAVASAQGGHEEVADASCAAQACWKMERHERTSPASASLLGTATVMKFVHAAKGWEKVPLV